MTAKKILLWAVALWFLRALLNTIAHKRRAVELTGKKDPNFLQEVWAYAVNPATNIKGE